MKQYSTLKKIGLFILITFASQILWAQQILVTGTISDSNSGEALPGVNIIEKGTTNGTSSDIDGKYALQVEKGKTIQFMFIGYKTIEIVVGDNSTINVQLTEEAEMLEELIVIGYGTQKKSDKTGAVANVKAEELNGGVLTDPIQALQGKTAGVSITKKGGDPNAGFSVKIRGASGLYSGTDPLYVVDGVPGVDPTTIAPEDIESYNVLKDASSTAIYGSRGANGVIIITTKRGKQLNRNNIEFSSYVSLDKVAKRLEFLTADQMRTYAADHGLNLTDGGGNTDWQDVIYRDGISQSYNIAASGSSENSYYRVSLAHSAFDGVIKGSSKERTIGRINLNQKAMDGRLNLQASLAGTFENNDYVQYSGSGTNDVLYQAFQRNPTDPVYNEDGSFYENQRDFNYYNPLALIEQIQNTRDAKRFYGNFRADYEIIKGLKAAVNLGYTRNDDEAFYFEPSYVRNNSSTGYGRRAYGNYQSKILETTLSYQPELGENQSLNFIAGYSFQEDEADGLWAQGREPMSDYVQSNNLGVLIDVNTGDIGSWKNSNRLISFFGRGVYDLNNKYSATFTLRRDGSSKFGTNNEWGIFPSGSIGWNIHHEDFMKNITAINQMRLRIGYGLAGNQEIGSYNDIVYFVPSGTTIDPETGEVAIQFNPSHNGNPDLRWETNRELNVGLDFALWENRISGSVEYYNKNTFDLLAPYAVPVPPNVVPTTWANAGEIENKGIELNLQAYVVDHSDFDWKTIFNFSKNRQKVLSLSSKDFEWTEADKKQGWLSGRGLVGDQNWTQLVEVGYDLGTFYMPEYAGLSQDGKFLFYTEAGGVTRDVDAAERRVVGHALPDFELGWSNYFQYKNFDLNISMRAVVGNDVLNVTRMVFANPSILPSLNALTEVLDEVDRGLTDYPKVNSYYLEDGSFIKIDNIILGYNFDVSNIQGISKMRIYFSSNNLFTFTKYTGLDPESSYNGLSFGLDMYNVYPKTRTFTFGVNVTF